MKRLNRVKASLFALCVLFSALTASSAWGWDFEENVPTTNELRGVHKLNDAAAIGGWAVGVNGTVLKRLSQGNWELRDIGASAYDLNHVFFLDSNLNYGWIVGQRKSDDVGAVWRTVDGGTSWNGPIFINPPLPVPTPFLRVAFATQYIGYIGAANGYILKTADGGQTWTPTPSKPSPFSENFYGLWVDPSNSNQLWASSDAGGIVGGSSAQRIVKTTDGGQNWTRYPVTDTRYTRGLAALSDFNKVIVPLSRTGNPQLMRTSNGGQSWFYQDLEPPGVWQPDKWLNAISSQFYSNLGSEQTLAAGPCGVIYESRGSSGSRDNLSLATDILDIDQTPKQTDPNFIRQLAVGTSGKILRYWTDCSG